MDLRQLNYFIAIADAGGFNAASRQCNITQSALSRHISALEGEIGAQLFDRNARGVILTEAGEVLRERVRKLLAEVSDLKSDVQAVLDAPTGEVILGLTPSMRHFFGADLVKAFLRSYPAVKLRVIEGTSVALLDMICARAADIGIIFAEDAFDRPIEAIEAMREPIVLAAPPQAGLTMDRPIALADLEGLPMITPIRPNRIWSNLERNTAKKGIRLESVVEVQNLHLAMDLISLGFGHMAVPYSTAYKELSEGRVCAAPIPDMMANWAIAWSSERPVTAAIRKLADSVMSELSALKDYAYARS